MNRYWKLGVILSDAVQDEHILDYAAHMASFTATEIHCFQQVVEGPPVSHLSAEELRRRLCRELAPDAAGKLNITVHDSVTLIDELRLAARNDLDLLIMGKRLPSSQYATVPSLKRLVRKAPCSVMAVPRHCRPHFSRIQVAVDCSQHARIAMQTAINLARAANAANSELLVQTVRHVDIGHDLAGATFHETAAAQERTGLKELEKFTAGFDTRGIKIELLVTLAHEVARSIIELAAARKMDVIVIGSRGKTLPAAALLGSNCEEVVDTSVLPVMVVKEKGETRRFFESLFAVD